MRALIFHNALDGFRCFRLMSDAAYRAGSAALTCMLFVLTAHADLRDRQDEAAYLAREGEFERALGILAELQTEYPDNRALLYDEAVIASWAGRDRQTLDAARRLPRQEVPAWVAAPIGKSARNIQRFDEAVEWYEQALVGAPESLDVRLGLSMALADAGRHPDARISLKKVPAAIQDTEAVLLTSAYLFQREGMYIPAVNEYDRILERNPGNTSAVEGKIIALQALLLPGEALQIAREHPGTLNAADIARLEGDSLGLALRRAIQTPNQVYPYTRVNFALARIDARLEQEPPGTRLALQLRYDRVVGRTEAYRTLEAIYDYEDLLEEGIKPPAYVHYAAARSYMQRKSPEEALAALETAEELSPDDLEIQIEKFYALVSLERHEEALELVDALEAQTAPVNQEGDSRVTRPNDNYTRLRILSGMGRAYADQLDEAQRRIEALLADAPNNVNARYSLGNLYRYRGWEDRPFPEYSQALTMDPELLPAQTSYAYAALERQQYPEAFETLSSIKPLYVGQLPVSNLNLRWLLYKSWQLIVDANWGDSSGDTFGSDQHTVNAWLFSPPVKDNYRFYLRTFDTYAEFEEGDEARRRIALGAEYRKDVWSGRVEANWNRTDGGKAGVAARVDRRINNEWSAGGALELNSYATQLRADRAGIESNLLVFDTTYSRNELYGASAGFSYQDYDDGNGQTSLFADSRYRFINGYEYKLDGLVNASVSTNSDGDETVYFAPERSSEVMIGVANEWRQWRRYEASLTHRLTALTGVSNQDGFGSDNIWTLAYRLDWAINESVGLSLGIEEGRRFYDGESEDQTFFSTSLNARF